MVPLALTQNHDSIKMGPLQWSSKILYYFFFYFLRNYFDWSINLEYYSDEILKFLIFHFMYEFIILGYGT